MPRQVPPLQRVAQGQPYLAVTAGGSLKSITTTPLLSIDQGITAKKRAEEVGRSYHPPVATSRAR